MSRARTVAVPTAVADLDLPGLHEVLLAAAASVLAHPAGATLAAAGVTPEAFTAKQPLRLLQVAAALPGLRAAVRAGEHGHPVSGRWADLLAEDTAARAAATADATAAVQHGPWPPDLAAAPPARKRNATSAGRARSAGSPENGAASTGPDAEPSPAADSDAAKEVTRLAKQLRYREQELARAKDRLGQAEGRLTNARDALARAEETAGRLREDLDEALAEAATATSTLTALRDRLTSPGGSAAALLEVLDVAARAAAAEHVHAEPVDPRDAELAGTGPVADDGETAAVDATAGWPAEVTTALDVAGISADQLTTFLRTVLAPPVPEPSGPVLVGGPPVRVVPLGGGTEIGGSCILVEAAGTRLLVDAGLRTNKAKAADMLPPRLEEALADGPVHAIVVTHAHADHCGYVPALVARYPGIPVIASTSSGLLMPTMWRDGVTVQNRRVQESSSYGIEEHALFDFAAVDAATRAIEQLPFGTIRRVRDVEVSLFPAGHILGAAGVVIRAGERRVVITGDISSTDQASVNAAVIPPEAVGADLLCIETTYCHDRHTDRATQVGDFTAKITEVLDRGGRVLVPAFALGRAQEVALLLGQTLGDVDVYVDGMAQTISRIYENAPGAEARRIFGGNVRQVGRNRDAAIAGMRHGVVITTSGMLAGGPAVTWAKHILPDPKSALLLTGYQDEESPGAALLNLAETGGGTFELDGRKVKVAAQVAKYGLSAHADRPGLLSIVDQVQPREVMLVHGIGRRQSEFGKVLELRSHACAPTRDWVST